MPSNSRCGAIGTRCSPSCDFNFAPPPHAQNYQRIFSGTCFGQPRTAAWFDADAFKQPVRRDRDALQSFLRATPGNVVGPYLNERSSARVRIGAAAGQSRMA